MYAVHCLTILCHPSSEVESQPKLVKLMNQDIHFWDQKAYFGYNSRVVIVGTPHLQMHSYSWPEGSSESESSLGSSNSLVGKFDENWGNPEYFAFNEYSG